MKYKGETAMSEKNKHILETVFKVLNSSNLDYCVQNKYEMMPEEIPSDIDMMYRNIGEEGLDEIINEIAVQTGMLITQKIVQDYGEYTYILSYPVPQKRFQLQLDFYRVISKGRIRNVLLDKDLLDNKRFYKMFYVPDKYDELRYIIVRRTLKKDFSQEHLTKIIELYDGKEQNLVRDFGQDVSKLVLEMIESNLIDKFYEQYNIFLDSIMQMSKKNYTIKDSIKYIAFKVVNYPPKRIFHTCGISVAFLAPDGTGKSTVIEGIKETCSGSFYGVNTYYFRPRVFKNLGYYNKLNQTEESRTNDDPHNVKVNGKVKSFVRFIFYNLDFVIGMNVKIRKQKMQKQLIIFDRYYYDYYADMKRYQYSLNSNVARKFRFMIPKPDLTIILDASPEVVLSRKQELTYEEIVAQREAYKMVAKDIKNVKVVNAEKKTTEVIAEVTKIILREQEHRTAMILK